MGECFSDFLKHIDMFGKEAKLYYKKEEQFNTNLGIFFSIIYHIAYISFLIYKLNRVVNHQDVTAYDTFKYISYKPSVKLNNNIFYGGFALQNPETYDSLIDERIYYPRAYYKEAVRNQTNNNSWEWEVREIELETCNITKFGKDFQNIFKKNTLNNLYCFKDINESFIGHFSFDNYSFFFLEFYVCKNTTENNNKCKTREEIDFYLNSTYLSMEFEDVELSPDNYKRPVSPRNQDIYFKVGKKTFQEVHVFFQILNIETDKEDIGLEVNELENKELDSKDYLKFQETKVMTTIIDEDIYENNKSFCNVTFKLHEQVRIQRRTYPKFFSILGDVSGLMEFLKVILNIFLGSIIALKYEIEIANNLFHFKTNINNNKNVSVLRCITFQLNKLTKYKIKEIIYSDKKKNKNSKPKSKQNKKQINNYIDNKDINNNFKNNGKNNSDQKNNSFNDNFKIEDIKNSYCENRIIKRTKTAKIEYRIEDILTEDPLKNKQKDNEIKNSENNIEIEIYNNNPREEQKKKININCFLVHLFSCCVKNFKKNKNVLFLKAASNMFSEKMDIYNIFKTIINIPKIENEKEKLTITD